MCYDNALYKFTFYLLTYRHGENDLWLSDFFVPKTILWNQLPVSFCQPCFINHFPVLMSPFLVHLPLCYHFYHPSHVHQLIPGKNSPILSTVLCQHLSVSQLTGLETYTAPGFLSFSFIFFLIFCTSHSPALVPQSLGRHVQVLNKEVNDVKFGCLILFVCGK